MRWTRVCSNRFDLIDPDGTFLATVTISWHLKNRVQHHRKQKVKAVDAKLRKMFTVTMKSGAEHQTNDLMQIILFAESGGLNSHERRKRAKEAAKIVDPRSEFASVTPA